MEDVDKIIFASISGLGCSFENDFHLDDFEPPHVVQVCALCLNAIHRNDEFSTVLSIDMSSKYKQTSAMSNAIKDLGYDSEIGYHTFMYVNTKDIRKLFLWLIERLPALSKNPSVLSALSPEEKLNRLIKESLQAQLDYTWNVSYEHLSMPTGLSPDPIVTDLEPVAFQKIQSTPISFPINDSSSGFPLFTRQVRTTSDIGISLIENHSLQLIEENEIDALRFKNKASALTLDQIRANNDKIFKDKCDNILTNNGKYCSHSGNDLDSMLAAISQGSSREGINKNSRFMNIESIIYKNEIDTSQDKNDVDNSEEMRKELESKLSNILQSIQTVLQSTNEIEETMTMLKEKEEKNQKSIPELEDNYKRKKKALRATEGEIEELESTIRNLISTLRAFESEWHVHKESLTEELEDLKLTYKNQSNDANFKKDAIKGFRTEGRKIEEEYNTNLGVRDRYKEELASIANGVHRTAYTDRILEIIGSIAKQQETIDQVLEDQLVLQKTISKSEMTLRRIFEITDEQIYTYASSSQDIIAKQSYKNLIDVHKNCQNILQKLKEINETERQIAETEVKLDSQKNSATQNLSEIIRDYQAIKTENDSLRKQIVH